MTDRPSSDRPVVVFTGPTITPEAARAYLDAAYLPPATQGSVVRCVREMAPSAILLIDGVFEGEPTVRHKEILWALSQGVAVYGAASMGALRAAELHPFGMVGVGLVFRWYRRYPLAPDDAVAVLHGPVELGAPPLTTALIDLRVMLRAAERAGAIGRALRLRLESVAGGLNFRDRTLGEVIATARGLAARSDRAEFDSVAERLAAFRRSQKRQDAVAALRRVSADLASEIGARRGISKANFVMTNAFSRDLEEIGISIE